VWCVCVWCVCVWCVCVVCVCVFVCVCGVCVCVCDAMLTELRAPPLSFKQQEKKTPSIRMFTSFDAVSVLKIPELYMSIHGIMAVPIVAVRIYYVLSTWMGCSIRESHQYK